jgi:hypothetical protein
MRPQCGTGTGNGQSKRPKPRQLIIAFSPGTVAEEAIADAAKKPLTSIRSIGKSEKYIFLTEKTEFLEKKLNFPPEQEAAPGKTSSKTGQENEVSLT